MLPINIMMKLGLLDWSSILIGFRMGWVTRKDIVDYAVHLLVNGNEDENIIRIASVGETLENRALFDLISNHVKLDENEADIDKWKLAYLLAIAESDDSAQVKIDKLQEVCAKFNYPEDMSSCSIYSEDELDPLVAMIQVIEALKERFKC